MYKNHNIVFFRFHRAVFLSVSLLLLIVLLFNFSACESKEKVIKIGNQSVLSGEDKFYGEDQLISLSMAASELSPVRIGGFDYTIELITKDDEGNAEKAFLIAQEFVAENAVAVIGSTFNGTTKSSIPVYSELNIPFITPSAPGEDISRGYQNFYRMIINNSQKIENIASFLSDDIKPEKLILIDNGEDYSVKLIDYIIEIFNNKKISFNKRYSVKNDSGEYDMLAENLLIDEPDVIFFCAKSNELADLIVKTNKLQLSCRFITEEMGMQEGITDAAEKIKLEGLIAIVPQPPSLAQYTEDKKSIDFWRKYTDFAAKMKQPALSKEGPGIFAPYSYDAFYILINAMKEANSIIPEDYSVELKKTSYAGITGQIAFNSNGDRLEPQSTKFIMKNGDWIRYSQ
jgi:branched-chain amino acid transport system substrate-binding protein